MTETRETHVERDSEGRVVDTTVEIKRGRSDGGFGLGLLLGALVIAGGIVAFAYTQGSFQQAGVEADRAALMSEQQLNEAAVDAREALDAARAQVDQAQNTNTMSETATN